MRKKNFRPGLYKEYLAGQKESGQKKEAAAAADVPEEQIIIENVKTLPKIISAVTSLSVWIIRIAIILIITILASIGLTVLVNHQLREVFIQFINLIF